MLRTRKSGDLLKRIAVRILRVMESDQVFCAEIRLRQFYMIAAVFYFIIFNKKE